MVKNVNELLSRSADIDAKTSEGSNALIMSALSNVPDAIQFFLDKGFYINETNNKGQTALITAATKIMKASVEYLIKAGADLNIMSTEGKTALTYAREGGFEDIANILEQAGAQ